MAATKGLGLARVAEAAGVSVATVSNAINRPHLVAEATRARIVDAMNALDFVPNRAAATLRMGSNRLLGLVVPEIVNPFYAAITEAIAVESGARGYALALCVSHDDPVAELRHFEMLAEHRAAGAIAVPLGASADRLTQLQMVGTHLVLIDRIVDEHNGCSVAMDDVLGGRMAAEHLLGSTAGEGIALVNGPHTIPQCADRRRGVMQALHARGARDEVVEFESPHMTVEEGFQIGRRIASTNSPRRIFCTNDQLALGVIRGLRDSGLTVPIDARVVGFGDLTLATEGDTQITSIAQPKAEMGRAAVRKVLSEITDGDQHRHTVTMFPPELVVRNSAPLP
ncbi:LacI family transcriptional regulator [Microbacterium sp. LRZ72]|uniref:LacI family DNA-binding transcriptional regulator n=1 Tax=Microbacterium sp. LRZ72 TaxID=2942481 RepID=UPI0029B0BBD2|nr:LacI family DNA-binding transcriptional regulator [Microbacterium sp. LRZ72]MDX2376466.1 LacI family transcriptional regulator [Microbacterium sp. LRZ72]